MVLVKVEAVKAALVTMVMGKAVDGASGAAMEGAVGLVEAEARARSVLR